MRLASLFCALALAALLVGGCPPENYATLTTGLSQKELSVIISDTTKEGPEIRAELEALGLPSPVIDALLRDKQYANQGGGNGRTAYAKIVQPAFLDLTPDEIQLYNFFANQVALAIADFFDTYDLNSADDLEAYLNAGGPVWTSIPDGVLPKLFLDFDPDLVLPLLP
jgi:hypothetical protein